MRVITRLKRVIPHGIYRAKTVSALPQAIGFAEGA
jgi:hypothetical protein